MVSSPAETEVCEGFFTTVTRLFRPSIGIITSFTTIVGVPIFFQLEKHPMIVSRFFVGVAVCSSP